MHDISVVGTVPPAKRLRYSSARILGRRAKILRVVRELLTQHGDDSFTIKDICDRAGVVHRTLYSAFGDKESAINAAIGETIVQLKESWPVLCESDDIEALLAEFDLVAPLVIELGALHRSVTKAYFSIDRRPALIELITELPRRRISFWVDHVSRIRGLLPGVDRERAILSYIDSEFCLLRRWILEEIGDADLARALKANLLMSMMAITRDAERGKLSSILARLNAA